MDYNRLDVPMFCDSQKQKDCKKTTPDFVNENKAKGIEQVGFQAKDIVLLYNVKSLVNGTKLNGEFTFDTYDKYDNTCYVTQNGGITYNVLLSDLELFTKKK